MRLEQLLAMIPTVYVELGQVTVLTGSGGPPDRSPDPRDKPIPANLSVVDHRHQLVRGLRWWVDAVKDAPTAQPVGESVTHMCALLLHYAPGLESEDRDELTTNLRQWLHKADRMNNPPDDRPAPIPAEALSQRVPVHVAAKALGVSVSTVKRRTPGREAGQVLIRDAAGPLCVHDLPPAWCAYCMRTGCADDA